MLHSANHLETMIKTHCVHESCEAGERMIRSRLTVSRKLFFHSVNLSSNRSGLAAKHLYLYIIGGSRIFRG